MDRTCLPIAATTHHLAIIPLSSTVPAAAPPQSVATTSSSSALKVGSLVECSLKAILIKVNNPEISTVFKSRFGKSFNDQKLTGGVHDLGKRGRNRVLTIVWIVPEDLPQLPPTGHALRTLKQIEVPTQSAGSSESQFLGDNDDSFTSSDEEQSCTELEAGVVKVGANIWNALTSHAEDPRRDLLAGFSIHPSASHFDYFAKMWPAQAMYRWVSATNVALHAKLRKETTYSEMMRYLGLMFYMTLYPLTSVNSYWTEETLPMLFPDIPVIVSAQFGLTRDRFRDMTACFSFVQLPLGSPPAEWRGIDALIDDFHDLRQSTIRMGEELCIDELFISWRGFESIEDENGMPHVTKNPHKPKGIGAELIAMADVQSGIMVALEICKGKDHNRLLSEGLPYGAAVTKRLAESCGIFGSGRRIYGDSRFASLPTVKTLRELGLHFTGVIKTATAGFPKEYLKSYLYTSRGQTVALKLDHPIHIMALGWSDCSPSHLSQKLIKTFISSCGTTLPGIPSHKQRRRRTEDGGTEIFSFDVPTINAVSSYFQGCGKVDRHNLLRQSGFQLENVMKSHSWHIKMRHGLFGIFLTDAFLAYRFDHPAISITFHAFIRNVISGLLQQFPVPTPPPQSPSHSRTCSPTKSDSAQIRGRCSVGLCKGEQQDGRPARVVWFCAQCSPNKPPGLGVVWVCLGGSKCWEKHTEQDHLTPIRRRLF